MPYSFILSKGMEDSRLEVPSKQTLSVIFSALSSEERLTALELFGQKKELTEIAKHIGMSRSGFQKIVDAFRELGLIERSGHRSYYKLSRKGEKILEIVRGFGKQLEPIEREMAKEKIKAVAFGSGLTKEDIVKLLEELKDEEK